MDHLGIETKTGSQRANIFNICYSLCAIPLLSEVGFLELLCMALIQSLKCISVTKKYCYWDLVSWETRFSDYRA